ncbi:protein of unknown function [Acidithiobacillus ferrivorans]|uniref:Single-stranded DNA-binding protein n=1 Tax=Acidithiobacillus ferrivorans TaxID=160808 RepID=A0A060UUB7_9PROT|nr:hypothetical protein [Acidithiobacillus ferrivorans]CDQ10373.1 hypothetical protein AFERRI_400154 [Acidithiobacillus ferrivorans]SMH64400.1 protein of unknown function [Acidithiobacillus ferrivorans]
MSKALCRFYQGEQFEYNDKQTGASKRLWKQPYDLEQGPGVRPLQAELMHANGGEVLPAGDYEVNYYLEKDRRGQIAVKIIDHRAVKMDAPKVVNG